MGKNIEELEEYIRQKNILITGGLGMIGSSIAIKLVRLGAQVTIVDSMVQPYGANYFNIKEIIDKVRVNKVDIRDRESIKNLVIDKDIVFNLAGQVSHNDSIADPFLDMEINYLGQLNVLEAVRHYSPRARILFSGSRLQFGKIECVPVTEGHPLRPLTPYALNKVAAENMYLFYNRVYGISTIVFRIANPYGPRAQMRHSKYAIVNWFLRLAMEDKPIRLFGDGNQIRDYIYIDDLSDAFILASIEEGASGQVFNVGSGEGTRMRDMARFVIETVGKGRIEFVPWPTNYINVETGDYITDISKIKKELGLAPKVNLRRGIELTYDFYRKYRRYYWD